MLVDRDASVESDRVDFSQPCEVLHSPKLSQRNQVKVFRHVIGQALSLSLDHDVNTEATLNDMWAKSLMGKPLDVAV